MSKKVLVIGSGPAGYPAALKLAALGAEVTVVEKNKAGGVCLNCGCIPSKSLLDAAHRFYTVKEAKALSSNPEAGDAFFNSFDFAKIQARRQAAVDKLQRGVLALFKAAKVNYIEGEASFTSPSSVKINGEDMTFDAIIIATGSKAFYPPPFDKYKEHLYDNSNIFEITELPKRAVIIGGGVIGCEFACIFNALGVQTTIVELAPSILPLEDESISRVLKTSFEKRGIKILTSTSAEDMSVENGVKTIHLAGGQTLEADLVLAAVGRTPDFQNLNLEAAGVEYDAKGIKVNPKTMQAKGNVYAAGDINRLCQLAHAATAQGEAAALNIMGLPAEYDNNLVPSAIYTWPEAASAGLTLKKALAQGYKARAKKSFMLANGRAVAQGETEGFAQIIEDEETGLILGAQIVGPSAGEMIHIPLMAMSFKIKAKEAGKLIFAHPTVSECLKEALLK